MVAPALVLAGAKAAKMIPKIAGGLKAVGGFLGNSGAVGDVLGNFGNASNILNATGLPYWREAKNDQAIAKAYQNYLNGITGKMSSDLESRAEKYDNKLQGMSSEAEPQFTSEANMQLPELGQLVQDISDENAEAQRQNRRQVQAELAQQGVRGGQAAILGNRATGELDRNLQRDINQTVYDEARNRQNSRLDYYSQKALAPWKTRASAYASSMAGANNALSNAQSDVYANAYNRAMANYGRTQRKGMF